MASGSGSNSISVPSKGSKTTALKRPKTLIGKTRESYQEDLFAAIEAGNFPKWELNIQVMPEAKAETVEFNPFDLTKVWPHDQFPLIPVGMLEFNKNPDN